MGLEQWYATCPHWNRLYNFAVRVLPNDPNIHRDMIAVSEECVGLTKTEGREAAASKFRFYYPFSDVEPAASEYIRRNSLTGSVKQDKTI